MRGKCSLGRAHVWRSFVTAVLAALPASSCGDDPDADTDTDTDGDCECDSVDDAYCEDSCVMVSCDGCHLSSYDCCEYDFEYFCDPEYFPECGSVGGGCDDPECWGASSDYCDDELTLMDCVYYSASDCYGMVVVDCYDPEDCPCGSGCGPGDETMECWCCTDAGVDGGADGGV
jgi:hypothetical protein